MQVVDITSHTATPKSQSIPVPDPTHISLLAEGHQHRGEQVLCIDDRGNRHNHPNRLCCQAVRPLGCQPCEWERTALGVTHDVHLQYKQYEHTDSYTCAQGGRLLKICKQLDLAEHLGNWRGKGAKRQQCLNSKLCLCELTPPQVHIRILYVTLH